MEIDRSDQLCDLTHNPFFFEIFQSPKFVSTKEGNWDRFIRNGDGKFQEKNAYM